MMFLLWLRQRVSAPCRIGARLALLAWLCLGAVISGARAADEAPEKRVALVIGNGHYLHAPALANPVNDAKAVSEAFRRLGIEVTEGYDLSDTEMRALLIRFSNSLAGAKGALVFYAGHGVALDGVNYLLPVNIALKTPADLDLGGFSVDTVLRQMRRDERVNIIILDACRDNPFAAVLANAPVRAAVSRRGLEPIEGDLARGALIAFSTDPGNTAFDGPEGAHSPFTEALLRHIQDPATPIEAVMHKVREEVFAATNSKQLPWVNTSIVGDFELNPAKAAPAPLDRDPAQTTENLLWESAERSGAAEDYQTYLDAYPKGVFAPLARRRIEHRNPSQGEAKRAPQGEIEEATLRQSDLVAAQTALARLGLTSAPASGVLDEAARAAIRTWQSRQGYAATGFLSKAQVVLLESESPPPARATVASPAPEPRLSAPAKRAAKPASKFATLPKLAPAPRRATATEGETAHRRPRLSQRHSPPTLPLRPPRRPRPPMTRRRRSPTSRFRAAPAEAARAAEAGVEVEEAAAEEAEAGRITG